MSLRGIIVFLAICFSIIYSNVIMGQNVKPELLFSDLLKPAPETLSITFLKGLPKFHCIFHDGFDRLSQIPINVNKGVHLEKYSIGNDTLLGKNSFQNEPFYEYNFLANSSIVLGIKNDSLAYNKPSGNKEDRRIACVDTKHENYGFVFKRSDNLDSDAKIAFQIKDINNFYYVRADKRNLEIYSLARGKSKRVFCRNHGGGHVFYVLISQPFIYLYSDYKYIGFTQIKSKAPSMLCGLFFSGEQSSEIDDFAIYYLDSFKENVIDKYIEDESLTNKQVTWGCEKGLIAYDSLHTNRSKKSLRFELNYYDDWQNHLVGFNRRTEIVLRSHRASALDTWIYSFDVLFPDRNAGDDYFENDTLGELFWQMHAPSNINMLSPNVGLYLKDSIVRLQTYSRSELRHDREKVKSNWDYGKNGHVAILVDKESTNSKLKELKRGVWHTFTIFVKEGYTLAHLPRTVLYIDGMKVADWFVPNAQNCGQPHTYMQMGIYKWSWKQSPINSNVRKRVLYFDNIYYLR